MPGKVRATKMSATILFHMVVAIRCLCAFGEVMQMRDAGRMYKKSRGLEFFYPDIIWLHVKYLELY